MFFKGAPNWATEGDMIMFNEECAHWGSLQAKALLKLVLYTLKLSTIKASELTANLNLFIQWFTFCELP
jgi:hypothetical protein